MLLLIDNYDSFTYNLAQAFGTLGCNVRVVRNDALAPEELELLDLSHLVISPGPGTPDDAGISLSAITRLAGRVPILGVCLGHQAIGQAFGGQVVRAGRVMHGKTSPVNHDGTGLYQGVPQPFEAARYHSLLVERSSIPPSLVVTAETPEGEVMGLRHADLPIHGLQFHPESFLTPAGQRILANFISN